MRTRHLAAAVVAIAMSTAALSTAANATSGFSLTAPDLNGRLATAPRPGEPTVVLFALHHGDQAVLDGWRAGLKLNDEDPRWLEVAYIGAPKPVRPMIEGSLRRTFATPAARAHMIPVFGGDPRRVAQLGLPTEAPLVVVFGPSGDVRASASGAYDKARAEKLAAALEAAAR